MLSLCQSTSKRLLIISSFLLASFQALADVPSKDITIINNTPNKIWPVLFIGKHDPVDQWLQAYFGNTDIVDDAYKNTNVYRVYIGGDPNAPDGGGVASGATVTISLPLYSTLTTSPNATTPNQYIDWWNGGRVSIYDNLDAYKAGYNKDKNSPVKLPTGSAPVTCKFNNNNNPCPLSPIFSADAALPVTDPEQLTEYTFGGIDPSVVPYVFSPTNVDYDISYVDHAYLPIAMEPISTDPVGYTGTKLSLTDFRTRLNNFMADTKWGFYVNSATDKKIPGAYNIIDHTVSLNSDINDSDEVGQKLINNWYTCVNTANHANHADCMKVDDLFKKNYQNFKQKCQQTYNVTEPALGDITNKYVKYIYGFVAFVTCSNGKDIKNNDLAFTPGADFVASEAAYKRLQYSNVQDTSNHLVFNPFRQFIHDSNYLNILGSYAFSIDDIVGNMQEPGTGIYIAVGGTNGLPNPNEYDPEKIAHIALGSTGDSPLKWVSYSTCVDPNIKRNFPVGASSFKVENSHTSTTNPCPIKVFDSKGHQYGFSIINTSPFQSKIASDYVQCASGDEWCKSITVNYDDVGGKRISTIGTSPPNSTTNIMVTGGLADGKPKWKAYGICNHSADKNFATDVSSFVFDASTVSYKNPCEITLQDSADNLYRFTVQKAAPFAPGNPLEVKDYITCQDGTQFCNFLSVFTQGSSDTRTSHVNTRTAQSDDSNSAITAPSMTQAIRVPGHNDQIHLIYTPAVWTGHDFDYTYFVNGVSTTDFTVNDPNDITLNNVPTTDVVISVRAIDKVDTNRFADSDITPVAGSGAPLTPPSIVTGGASWIPVFPNTLALTYIPATGGHGLLTLSFKVDGQPYTNVQQVGLNHALLHDIDDKVQHDIQIIVTDGDGSTATTNLHVSPKI